MDNELLVEAQIAPDIKEFIDAALEEAAAQVDVITDDEDELKALRYERAIENTIIATENGQQAILQMMWVMEKEMLWKKRGATSLYDWAISNPRITQRWKEATISRYTAAISRILPELIRTPIADEHGEVVTPERLLSDGTISAITDYSYTFDKAEKPEEKREIVLSILRHDNERQRDGLIKRIRKGIQPVVVYAHYEEDVVEFRGRCTHKEWMMLVGLLGSAIDERGETA